MRTFRHPVLISSVALTAYLTSSLAFAACVITPESTETIVRGRFLRCEDTKFYLEASGAYREYERDVEAALARVGPENEADLLQRLGLGVLTPGYEARVAIVLVEKYVHIVPWMSGVSEAVEFKDQPHEFRETIRYWWNGTVESCEALASGSVIDLWVHAECCDTFELRAPVCLVGMNYAEPLPSEMTDSVSEVLGDL